jgi:hypothetical protein
MNGVAEQLKQLLLENLNPDVVVLDIRYLSQGNLEEILKIADLFIPKKTLIKLHKKIKRAKFLVLRIMYILQGNYSFYTNIRQPLLLMH